MSFRAKEITIVAQASCLRGQTGKLSEIKIDCCSSVIKNCEHREWMNFLMSFNLRGITDYTGNLLPKGEGESELAIVSGCSVDSFSISCDSDSTGQSQWTLFAEGINDNKTVFPFYCLHAG